jgi:hypothetical protein
VFPRRASVRPRLMNLSSGTSIPAPKSGALQTGPGFTRRLGIPPFQRLAPRVLTFADNYEGDAT